MGLSSLFNSNAQENDPTFSECGIDGGGVHPMDD